MGTSEMVDYLEKRADEALRGVVRYSGNENDVMYLREDVRQQRLRSQIDRMLERLQPETAAAEERAFPLGDLYVTIRRFEEAIIMHFPLSGDSGVVVSLEPEMARNLNTFTTKCLNQIHDQ